MMLASVSVIELGIALVADVGARVGNAGTVGKTVGVTGVVVGVGSKVGVDSVEAGVKAGLPSDGIFKTVPTRKRV